jgi:hypothetical protein
MGRVEFDQFEVSAQRGQRVVEVMRNTRHDLTQNTDAFFIFLRQRPAV